VVKSKRVVFHNALNDPFREVPSLAASPRQNRLICVGRFFPSKGQDILIRALPILQKTVPEIHVEFIGAGPEKNSLEKLATSLGVSANCTFIEQVDHGEVLRRMGRAVATVVPSRHEAFGLVNIESLAVGTPVIASRVGGIVEIIRDGIDGFLVPPDNVEVLARKLLALISNPHLRHEMHCNARQRFLSAFELQGAISEQANWFESIAPKHRSADSFVRANPATPQTLQNLN
jgi:glycosyltransferase involved in cell wall biosynthesis